MSGKTIKSERREEKEKRVDFLNRRDDMMKELTKLSEKYRIDLMGVLKYGDMGIHAEIALVDVKEKYEHLTEEAKKQNQAEKSKIIVPESLKS